MSAYHLQGVRFTYGAGAPALVVPELDLAAGGVTAFCGPNGSGKTTLLHLLALLATPSAGSVRFFGELATPRRLPALRRQVSLLLQSPYLFRGSVQANVEWGLKVRGTPADTRRRAAARALERVGLVDLARRPAAQLSGGERQRVALARVLALDPRAVCLDEPTNHLDGAGREALQEVLASWVAERGVTLVLATHDTAFARRLGARVLQLAGGALRPAEPDNLIRGHVLPGEPVAFQAGRVRLAVHSLPPGTGWVHIGPRQVVLAREVQPSSARNQLEGRITAVAPLADDELLVTVDCGIPLQAVITRASWQLLHLEQGGPVVAAFKASAVEAG
ncbi:MAG: ATP-binding cassette domain-containing protein [Deferrisomatales bacterium]|nr:ATP-binding cassette domain-containing protein [Deferrisomatales bacterium]